MTFARAALLSATAAFVAGGAALALMLNTANAASDVQVTAIDCESHPRRIAIQNKGDTAQDLAGWTLQSNKPSEVFDLSVVGTILPVLPDGTNSVYVFNGHQAPLTPQPPIWPWNPTELYEESAFVLWQDGTDFIRLVNAAGREASSMPCPGTLEIPPLPEPTPTPTPPPSGGNTGDTNQPQVSTSDNTQTSGGQETGGSQNVPAANTTAGGRSGPAAQTGNVSDQALGGPSSGVGVLSPASGGSPFAEHPLALSLLGVVAGAALSLLGVRMMRRALRRP